MTLLLGSIGWGLIATGTLTHLWHHDRLRELLAMHVDADRPAAAALVTVEAALAIALPVGVFADASWLPVVAIAAAALGFGFTVWIARLLMTGSELPCACSFSQGPTSRWSLVRAALIMTAVALVAAPGTELSSSDIVASLAVGLAIAGAVFVVPEALSWPAPLRAQLARLDSHAPVASSRAQP